MLFIFLKKEKFFDFNLTFKTRFIRILLSAIIMGVFLNFLINFFANNLTYEEHFKSVYIIGIVLIGLISYLLIAISIKAFKISDINLKY